MHFLQKLCLQLVEVELILSSRQIGQENICFSCWCQEATSCSAVSSTILTKYWGIWNSSLKLCNYFLQSVRGWVQNWRQNGKSDSAAFSV